MDSFSGHLENFQDPDVGDDRGETAAWKAARYDDLSKLKILDMACAKFDKQASQLHRTSLWGRLYQVTNSWMLIGSLLKMQVRVPQNL